MQNLGLTWQQALSVVASTIGIYVTFVALIRFAGQRILATMSSVDLAAALAFGAVTGRVVLGYTPTLLAGVLGLVTLVLLQLGFGTLRRRRRVDRTMSTLPLLLMVDGRTVPEHLHRARIAEDELRAQLRLAGVRRYGDVAAVILERTGQVSVLARGETLSPDLLDDVRGREMLQHHTQT